MTTFNKKIFYYIALNIVIITGLIFVLHLWDSNLVKYPLGYTGDATQVYYFYNTYIQDGVFAGNSRAGVPYISNALDFSTGEFISIFVQSTLMKLTPNFVAGVNFMYIFAFLLAGNVTFYVLSRLKFSNNISFLGAVLYSFLPFHFFRGVFHYTYGFYWFVPLVLYYVLYYLSEDEETTWGGDQRTVDRIMHIVMILAASSHGIYFTFFSMFFMTVALFLKMIIQRKKSKVWIDFTSIFGIYLLSCIPVLASRIIYGSNGSVANRMGMETELYSLKLAQLLMPITGHRIGLLERFRSNYNSYPLTTENHTVSLGLFMSIGLIFLLLGIFISFKSLKRNNIYINSVKLCAAALLLASVGTFSTFISFILPGIRGYNRIAPYIAFLSLLGFAIIVEIICNRFNNNIFSFILMVIVVAVGVYDQTTSNFVPAYESIKTKWDNDEAFVSKIEDKEEEGAWIYQMPYVPYPESGIVNGMGEYEEFTGLFHSKDLKWSYGTFAGREGDIWNKDLQNYDLDEQVRRISAMGFAGIYIDKSGLGDEFDSTISELQSLLGVKPIVSDDNNLYYLTMSKYNKNAAISEAERQEVNIFPSFSAGFYETSEDEEDNEILWSQNESEIVVYNMNESEMKSVNISFDVDYVDGGVYTLTIDSENASEDINENHVVFSVDLKPGKNVIKLTSDFEGVVDEYGNPLCFSLNNFLVDIK